MKKPIIQVAGILSLEEANQMVSAGFTHIGYPLVLDHHKEDIPIQAVAKIVSELKSDCTHVIITYLTRAEEIAKLLAETGCQWVQIHGDISKLELKNLKVLKPEITVIKSLVIGKHDIKKLKSDIFELEEYCDYFITDTFDPLTGASGATGKTHDWTLSKKLIDATSLPVIIAGGLNPSNIEDAINATKPAGVDVHTGIELESGKKSSAKAKDFCAKAIAALAQI